MNKIRFPHPLVLLSGFVLAAMLLTYVLPAGEYDREFNEASGRNVVVAGSYQKAESSPVNFFDAIVSIPKGMIDASEIIFLVFLIGGAFAVVDQTGAIRDGITWFSKSTNGNSKLIVIVLCILFAAAGALNNFQEEIIALTPMLLVLTNSLGYAPISAVAIGIGSAGVGASFSPINPFQVGIAQKIAELPLLSGAGYRLIFLIIAVCFWIWWVLRIEKVEPNPSEMDETALQPKSRARVGLILLLVVVTFLIMVLGLLSWDWGFNQMSAIFFLMGIASGLVGKMGLNGTAIAFSKGFREMTLAAIIIGFARSIYVILEDGVVIDTLVHGLFSPISNLPKQISAVVMMVSHVILHIPVPSVSSHAVLTMPLLTPLSDLIGLSRQISVLAYQYGAGLADILTPTNGALIAILAASGIKYDQWFKFFFKKFLILLGIGSISVLLGIYLNL